ncbi:GtrA family protein [Pelotomaculum propionicicum]|uniref:GtrA family protein n=1 Tax=Pelotomaculum propionicicum TaxID=258475 RepID=UPI003B76F22D
MENVLQLFKFAAVGCVNTLIDWAVYFVILKIFPAESAVFYAAAKGFSYFCGIINSFFLNRFWTFKDSLRENEGGRFTKFLLVNLVGLGFNSGSLYIFLNLELKQTMALFFATFITFSFNFVLNKLWVFRKGKMVAKTSGG